MNEHPNSRPHSGGGGSHRHRGPVSAFSRIRRSCIHSVLIHSVDPSHHGPVISYLYVPGLSGPWNERLAHRTNPVLSAKIPDAQQSTVTGLQWFKIYEDGFIAANQSWGVDRMIANKGKVTFTIPSCIAAGQYLLRHEMIGAFIMPLIQSVLPLSTAAIDVHHSSAQFVTSFSCPSIS